MNINTLVFGETWLEKAVVSLGKNLKEDVSINRVKNLQEAKKQLNNKPYDLFVLEKIISHWRSLYPSHPLAGWH